MKDNKQWVKALYAFLVTFVDVTTALPIALFSLPTIILFPSVTSVSFFVLGAIVSALLYGILLVSDDVKRLQECLSGFLRPFSKCRFIEYEIDDFALHGSYALKWALDGQYFSVFGKKKRVNMKRDIKIYVVKKGASSIVPMQMVSYESFYSTPSYIFVRDEPNKISPLGRFFIYHEVGHSSHQNVPLRRFTHRGLKFLIFPIFFVVFNLRPNLLSYSVLCIYVLLVVLTYFFFKFVISRQARQIEEENADLFAISHLGYHLNESLEEYLYMAGKLPEDSLLTNEQNLHRYNLLVGNLRKLRLGSTDESPSMKYTDQVLYCLSILGVFFVGMGFLSRPPSITLLCLNGIFIFVLVSALLWNSYKIFSLKEEIQKIVAS